jgi:hypothetical protein
MVKQVDVIILVGLCNAPKISQRHVVALSFQSSRRAKLDKGIWKSSLFARGGLPAKRSSRILPNGFSFLVCLIIRFARTEDSKISRSSRIRLKNSRQWRKNTRFVFKRRCRVRTPYGHFDPSPWWKAKTWSLGNWIISYICTTRVTTDNQLSFPL